MHDSEQIDTNGSFIELLTFSVAGQEYALDIMSVREIRGWTATTPLPLAPNYVCGVTNLRGTVLTVVDLALRLNVGEIEASDRNVTIVVQVGDDLVGLLVDAVSDILPVSETSFQQPPKLDEENQQAFVSHLTIQQDRLIRILDLAATVPVPQKGVA